MNILPASVEVEFTKSNFSVHHKRGTLNGVWADIAIEQSYNKDAKTHLFNGITHQENTMDKYIHALPLMTCVSKQVLEMINKTDHKDASSNANDSDAVEKVISVLKERMINPFKYDGDNLINISTGRISNSTEVADGKEKGIAALVEAETSNASTIKIVRLKGFEEKHTKKNNRDAKKQISQHESCILRQLCFTRTLKNSDMIETFQHEWTPYPASLFEENQTKNGYMMRKGNKADFLVAMKTDLESDSSDIEQEFLPTSQEVTGYAVDGMGFIQKQQFHECRTFSDVEGRYLQQLLNNTPEGCSIIHFVGDMYDAPMEKDLKYDERLRRCQHSSDIFVPRDFVPIPLWNAFKSNTTNKMNLLHYLQDSWIKHYCRLPEGIHLILGGLRRKMSVLITNKGV